jgi:N-acetylmuramoyl-L-alanine amidase
LSFFVTSIGVASQGILANRVIVIDPGHGGIYPGAVANGIREADVNLAVALKLRDRLVNSGATVALTRSADTNVAGPGTSLTADLQARVDIATASQADIFISLHANSHPNPKIFGVMSFYATGQPSDLARTIYKSLVGDNGFTGKGVWPANFYVLRKNQVPAALIEMGFLTNPTESQWLTDDAYQSRLADSIYDGILNYFQLQQQYSL